MSTRGYNGQYNITSCPQRLARPDPRHARLGPTPPTASQSRRGSLLRVERARRGSRPWQAVSRMKVVSLRGVISVEGKLTSYSASLPSSSSSSSSWPSLAGFSCGSRAIADSAIHVEDGLVRSNRSKSGGGAARESSSSRRRGCICGRQGGVSAGRRARARHEERTFLEDSLASADSTFSRAFSKPSSRASSSTSSLQRSERVSAWRFREGDTSRTFALA